MNETERERETKKREDERECRKRREREPRRVPKTLHSTAKQSDDRDLKRVSITIAQVSLRAIDRLHA